MKILTTEQRKAQYFEYLKQHIGAVRDAFESVQDSLDVSEKVISEARKAIQDHDKSKYLEDEFYSYLDHFYPADGSDPPEEDPEFDKAWLLHIHRNPHHWQYWVLTRDSGDTVCLDMPESEVLAMLCDWHSFSRKDPSSTAVAWYTDNKNNMKFSKNTEQLIAKHIQHFHKPLV